MKGAVSKVDEIIIFTIPYDGGFRDMPCRVQEPIHWDVVLSQLPEYIERNRPDVSSIMREYPENKELDEDGEINMKVLLNTQVVNFLIDNKYVQVMNREPTHITTTLSVVGGRLHVGLEERGKEYA